jgi:hypothetical protein
MEKKFEHQLVKSVVEQLYLNGFIAEDDLDNGELIIEKFKESLNSNGELEVVIDHRDDLLNHAKYFENNHDLNMALVMYSTFFEHAINSIIVNALIVKGFDNKSKIEVIRSATLHAKFSWILKLLDLPKFNEKHMTTILRIAEKRNAHVHYKFSSQSIEYNNRDELTNLLSIVRKSVRYSKSYESKVLYGGNKGSVRNKISSVRRDS